MAWVRFLMKLWICGVAMGGYGTMDVFGCCVAGGYVGQVWEDLTETKDGNGNSGWNGVQLIGIWGLAIVF